MLLLFLETGQSPLADSNLTSRFTPDAVSTHVHLRGIHAPRCHPLLPPRLTRLLGYRMRTGCTGTPAMKAPKSRFHPHPPRQKLVNGEAWGSGTNPKCHVALP